MIEQWNGSAWSLVPAPDTGQAFDQLTGVQCLAADDCWAVGNAGPTQQNPNFLPIFPAAAGDQGLVEHWDGSSWSLIPSVAEPSPNGGYLNGVTCVSSTDCWASGATTTYQRDRVWAPAAALERCHLDRFLRICPRLFHARHAQQHLVHQRGAVLGRGLLWAVRRRRRLQFPAAGLRRELERLLLVHRAEPERRRTELVEHGHLCAGRVLFGGRQLGNGHDRGRERPGPARVRRADDLPARIEPGPGALGP